MSVSLLLINMKIYCVLLILVDLSTITDTILEI